ncbi:MAG: YfhO family protein, partial [Verrucomicrobiota bacterium]|nr:YfhO family protein [Verrucomicrobiota bacterium]
LNQHLRLLATIYLAVYGLVLIVGGRLRKQRLAAWALVAISALELIQFDRITVSTGRSTVTKNELRARTGYNDLTVEALQDIKANEHDFFRLTKTRPSAPGRWVSLNDAMVFGYYDTSSYSSFNNTNYIRFLAASGAVRIESELDTRWVMGVRGDPLLAAFVCEKYLLTEQPQAYAASGAYTRLADYGADTLLRNQLFLPLGLAFTDYITEQEFARLSRDDRDDALVRVAVLPDDDAGAKSGLVRVDAAELRRQTREIPLQRVLEARRQTALALTSFRPWRITGTMRLGQKIILVVQTPFDRGWRALVDKKDAPTMRADAGLLGVAVDSGEHMIELRYRSPFLPIGCVISAAALFILAIVRWRWPRLPFSD